MTEKAELQTDAKSAKWTITVGGNEWGTVKYGIVEYLRKHPRMRAITAILGLLWVVGWVASTMGFKWHGMGTKTVGTVLSTWCSGWGSRRPIQLRTAALKIVLPDGTPLKEQLLFRDICSHS